MVGGPLSTALPLLTQFRFSMYPEKVRWALDYKQIPHRRRDLLPGPHVPHLMLRTGQKQVPVLTLDGRRLVGSAAILDAIEVRWPTPPLYPSAPALRAEALAEQARWDEVGVHVRRAFFADLLGETAFAADAFSTGKPGWVRAAYRLAFPLIRVIMRQDMTITPAAVAESLQRTTEALDRVAAAGEALVGGRFSVADLCAATVLQPVALPPEFPVTLPQPYPPGLQRWLDRWASHPGAAWVRRTYQTHRGR